MTFYLVVKAKHAGRLLDEVILEFQRQPPVQKIEAEIRNMERELKKYWNLKDMAFSIAYAQTERDAKKSQLWSVYGKGHYIVMR